MLKPLCFMVMPYGTKATGAEAGQGPAEIDFNALWDRAYVPAILALGYEPVRADQDTGALIVTQMLERLYFADLVLADMTIPNGNVYYEIGIRHASRPTGCVLLAADWSRPLFDIAQMRTVRYPLPEGTVTPETALAIRAAIERDVPSRVGGLSPMRLTLPGYPSGVDANAAPTMRDQMTRLAQFQAEVRAVRALPRSAQMARAQALVARYATATLTAQMAIALLLMLRDCVDAKADWNIVLGFIERLPDDLRSLPEVDEQRALALSYAGWHVDAIAALEALIATSGATPERLGLLGGRYKRLFVETAIAGERARALDRAIEQYERGMELDLNEYYCAVNLPTLYRARGGAGDEERALSALRIVIAACERARRRGTIDPWLRKTLLVAAFDAYDADLATTLADDVEREDAAQWQLASALESLEASVLHVVDPQRRDRLERVLERLRRRQVG